MTADEITKIAAHGNWSLKGTHIHSYNRDEGQDNMRGLDQHITGNWGEDSVAPEFIKAEELGDMEASATIRIDVAPQSEERQIVATVKSVAITSGFVYVTAEEFAYPFIIPVGTMVYFADDED